MKESIYALSDSNSNGGLVFAFQANLVMHSGMHLSIHPSCHYQMVFAKSHNFLPSTIRKVSMLNVTILSLH